MIIVNISEAKVTNKQIVLATEFRIRLVPD